MKNKPAVWKGRFILKQKDLLEFEKKKSLPIYDLELVLIAGRTKVKLQEGLYSVIPKKMTFKLKKFGKEYALCPDYQIKEKK